MSHAVRLHMCQVYVCTAQDVVLCCGSSVSLLCPVVFVLWLGRCGGLTRKHSCLPTLRGGSSRRTPHHPLGPTSWAPVQRESRTVRPISLAFLGVQQTVGCQSTRATSRGSRGGKPFSAPSELRRLHALLNASAARRVDRRWRS